MKLVPLPRDRAVARPRAVASALVPFLRLVVRLLALVALTERGQAQAPAGEVTLTGSLYCNGGCLPEPKPEDHLMVVYAIDGPPEIRAEVARIVKEFYPEGKALDAEGARRLMDEFSARVKYYLAPESPALREESEKKGKHYCHPAAASAVTGIVSEKDGKRWITATKIAPARLKFPERMYAPDKPFVMPGKEPLVLKIDDKLTLKCVSIPAGKFLMGTPVYMWPNFVEEFPHMVTLTKSFYLAEIPVTQEIYESVMGANPSAVKDPQLPVQNPAFADLDKFCQLLSEKTGRKVRLPSEAEWEYAARVGTSDPGFQEKYKDQNSSGGQGFKVTLKVKSKQPNAWGLYDMASCWWEVTGDKGMYNVRQDAVDPHYPPRIGPAGARVQRSGRGILQDRWSVGTHEFITEKGYAGNKFRILVEDEAGR